MRPVSEATSRIARHNFSKKFIAIGRIVEHWDDIMGEKFADKAQPLKIHYRKNKRSDKPSATLDIATSSSYATILPYQKDVIIERINNIFGDKWITDIKFIASEMQERKEPSIKKTKPLTGSEKKYLSSTLENIDDNELKERLDNLGKAIITEKKS